VYKIKYETNKGRQIQSLLGGESCFQIFGIDFIETYTLVAKFELIKAMLEL